MAIKQLKLHLERNEKNFIGSKKVVLQPIFQYVEFCTWNPMGISPVIVARDFDPKSELARKCRDKELRKEEREEWDGKDEKQKFLTHSEHINIVYNIVSSEDPNADEDVFGQPVVYTYRSGNYILGTQTCASLAQLNAPIYAGNWIARADMGVSDYNSENDWYGLTIRRPRKEEGVDPFANMATYNASRKLFQQWTQNLADQLIHVDHDAEDLSSATNTGRFSGTKSSEPNTSTEIDAVADQILEGQVVPPKSEDNKEAFAN